MPPAVLMLSVFNVDEIVLCLLLLLLLVLFVMIYSCVSFCDFYNFSFELTLMWCEMRARLWRYTWTWITCWKRPFFSHWVVWPPCRKFFNLKCEFSVWFLWLGCLSILKSVTCWFDLLWLCTLWNWQAWGCNFSIMLSILHFLYCYINFSVSCQFY